jgi:single-strand DNA-binding protein
MAASVNKAILVGNVGKQPEIKTFQNGGRIASFSIATSENWKDKQTGERQERTQWHRIAVVNEPLIKFVEAYVKKGSKLYVEGQIETRKWTAEDGSEKFSTEVVLRPYRGEITMLDSAKEPHQENTNPQSTQPAADPPGVTADMLDDKIPF